MSIADQIMTAPYAFLDQQTAACFVKMFNRGLGYQIIPDLMRDANVHDQCDNPSKARIIRQLARDIASA